MLSCCAMKMTGRILAAGLLFFVVGASDASANVLPISTDPSYADSFIFYCEPYTASFVEGGEYIPELNDNFCTFSIPSTISGARTFEILRGVPGNAVFVGGDTTTNTTYTLMDVYPNSFAIPTNSLNAPLPGTKFFAVVFESSLGTAFKQHIRTGSAAPAAAVEGDSYYIVEWEWGTPTSGEGFSFFCNPYKHSFEEHKHYVAKDGACTYSVPGSIGGQRVIGLYRGTLGDAAFLSGGLVYGSPTLVQDDFIPFSLLGLADGEDLFAVVYDYTELGEELHPYLAEGAPLPPNAVLGDNYFILPWKWGATPVEEFDPVVIIPGFLGSWEKDGELVMDPIFHTYDNLVDTLLANGYVEGETLFKFPYEWRQSNVVTASILKEKIEEIKDVCECSRVDIVAHSMGGLVAAHYAASDEYGGDVDQVVFFGTPFSGSPKAYKTWEAGEIVFGTDAQNAVVNRIFTREARENGFNDILSYIRSGLVASLEQLLPVYPNYLKEVGATDFLSYPSGYPRNTFLEALAPNYADKVYKNIRPYVVTGDTGYTTIRGYEVQPSTEPPKWEHGEPVATLFGKGDGTVLEESAAYFTGPDKEIADTDHSAIVSAGAGYAFETFNNRQPEVITENRYGLTTVNYGLLISKLAPSPADFRSFVEMLGEMLKSEEQTKQVLLVELFSPIDMQIVAPDGKRLGKDFATSAVVSEIPNAAYSGFDAEHEFAIIFDPLPGTYAIETVGTGEGPYTVAAGYVGGDVAASTGAIEGYATVGGRSSYSLGVSSTTTEMVLVEVESPPQVDELTPKSCIADLREAYKNKWIKKKAVYTKLVADCALLGILFDKREKLPKKAQPAVVKIINRTLADMDKLAKDKGNTQEAKDLIYTYTQWFREHKIQK